MKTIDKTGKITRMRISPREILFRIRIFSDLLQAGLGTGRAS